MANVVISKKQEEFNARVKAAKAAGWGFWYLSNLWIGKHAKLGTAPAVETREAMLDHIERIQQERGGDEQVEH